MKAAFLSTLAVISSLVSFSQSFEFKDVDDAVLAIEHMFVDGSVELSATKLHIGNVSGSSKNFKVRGSVVSNPTNVQLQICFGGGCFLLAPDAVDYNPPAFEPVSAGGIFDNFKIGPFSYDWAVGDSATWKLLIYDEANIADSSVIQLTWKSNAPNTTSVLESESAPFRVSANEDVLNIFAQGTYDQFQIFDINGKLVLSNSFQSNIDISDLNGGLYFIRLKANNQWSLPVKFFNS